MDRAGLAGAARWDRRRLALQVPRAALLCFDEFPRLAEVQGLLPRSRATLRCASCSAGSTHAVRRRASSAATAGSDQRSRPRAADSDLDLWIAVDDAAHADAVAHVLQSFGAARPRLDGELVFGDGAAVAWREWADWRAGRARAVMVKRLNGVALRARCRVVLSVPSWRSWPHERPLRCVCTPQPRRLDARGASAAPPRSRCTTSWRWRPSRAWCH